MSLEVATDHAGFAEEGALRALGAGDRELAATLMLKAYGHEVSRFLAAIHRDPDDAAEVFAEFAAALWTAVPSFEGRSSIRTWMYAIARRTSLRHRRDARRRRQRFEALPDASSSYLAIEAELRTATLSFLRTERRSKLAAIRESLSVEDQMLLMLRVDRKLPWNDLAIVLTERTEGRAAPVSEETLKRVSARLRKRYQVLKDRIREIGRREGLLPSSDEP